MAHADQRPVAVGASVTFGQIDDAIDVLGKLFRRDYGLFTAADMYTLEPIIQHDWKAVFRVRGYRIENCLSRCVSQERIAKDGRQNPADRSRGEALRRSCQDNARGE